MTYTYLKDEDGDYNYCSCGQNFSILEFAGFCEKCWLKLTPAQRAILKGEEPPVEKIITRYEINPPSLLLEFVKWVWIIGISAATSLLLWNTYGH